MPKLTKKKQPKSTVKLNKTKKMKTTKTTKMAKTTKKPGLTALQGAVVLEKQWNQAKKAWLKTVKQEMAQLTKTISRLKSEVAEQKGLLKDAGRQQAASSKIRKGVSQAKLQKLKQASKAHAVQLAKNEKMLLNAQKELGKLKQLVAKTQAINKMTVELNKTTTKPVKTKEKTALKKGRKKKSVEAEATQTEKKSGKALKKTAKKRTARSTFDAQVLTTDSTASESSLEKAS